MLLLRTHGDEKDGETKRDEYLVNHILNKSETILISILSVM